MQVCPLPQSVGDPHSLSGTSFIACNNGFPSALFNSPTMYTLGGGGGGGGGGWGGGGGGPTTSAPDIFPEKKATAIAFWYRSLVPSPTRDMKCKFGNNHHMERHYYCSV